ncbi:MAG: sigma-54-dependent Fis family transcriptional regulator [Planctomycetes bacterium]|nr:sigma-54-dependent Fis family transcriptional regulator [Planctomycetota bacterium]
MHEGFKGDSATISGKFVKGVIAFEHLRSRNEDMQRCIDLAIAASQTTASVLVLGESGTGKNLIAQAIHNGSSRADKPCITLNCSAIPENLLESELFGHDRGAFTGAERNRRGKFELADGGTLILDEIGEMSPTAQAKVLRAVEYGQFEHVGGEETLRSDVRIIAITNRDLPALVAENRFREDLFYRLNEITLHVPPLRFRREDISVLIDAMILECNQKFAKHVMGISQIGLDYLMRYDFPGNIRELKSLIKRAMTVAKGDQLWLEDLGMRVEVPAETETGDDPEQSLTLAAMERRHIQQVLDYTRGNKKRASEILLISRPTLDRKIKIYDLRV